MKLNFWEEFAISTGISALQVLASSTTLSTEQKSDIEQALIAVQKVAADFQ